MTSSRSMSGHRGEGAAPRRPSRVPAGPDRTAPLAIGLVSMLAAEIRAVPAPGARRVGRELRVARMSPSRLPSTIVRAGWFDAGTGTLDGVHDRTGGSLDDEPARVVGGLQRHRTIH